MSDTSSEITKVTSILIYRGYVCFIPVLPPQRPARKVVLRSDDTCPASSKTESFINLNSDGLFSQHIRALGYCYLLDFLFQKTTPPFSSSLCVAKKKFFFDESSIIHLTGIKSPSVIREAIVSGDSLLEPGGGVFCLTSNSPLNKFLETLRESVHPIIVFNALINNISHSSHDPSFNVSPLLLLCESPL